MNVKNKIAVVTGGANGIGYKFAEELLKNDAKCVVIADASKENGEKALATFEKEYGKGRAIFLLCDVSKPDQLESTFASVMKHFGGFDILVNNAGILDDGRWELEIQLNLVGVIRSTLFALDLIGKHKGGNGGTIVNISSVAGLMPSKYVPVYGATKHGVLAFTQSIAEAVHEKTGVRFLIVCPGATETVLMHPTDKNLLNVINEEEAMKFFGSIPTQQPEHVAKGLIEILEKGKNGAAYVAEDNKPLFAVDFPHYTTRKLPV